MKPLSWSFSLLALLAIFAGCGDEGGGATPAPMEDVGGEDDASDDAGGEGGEDAPGDDVVEGPAQRELPPLPWAADEPGYYGVGQLSEQVVYETFDGEQRQLRLFVWYPTRDEGVARPDVEHEALLPTAGATLGLEGSAPLLVFSHGSGGFPEQSLFFTNYFVSHGFVVVAPSHTGNDVLGQPIDVRFFVWRPEDIRAVLDHVDGWGADHPLAGRLSGQVIMSGHSFGGYTSLAVSGATVDVEALRGSCAAYGLCGWLTPANTARLEQGFLDPRIQASIPMAPAGARLFYEGLGAMEVPTLLFTGGMDNTLPDNVEGAPIWDYMDNPDDVRVHIIGAGHYSFTDVCASVGQFFEDDGCGPRFAAPAQVHTWVNIAAMAFARLHLFGDDAGVAILTGQERLGAGVLVSPKDN